MSSKDMRLYFLLRYRELCYVMVYKTKIKEVHIIHLYSEIKAKGTNK